MRPTASGTSRVRLLAVVAAVAALGAGFSCKTFDLPSETCDPSGLHTEPLVSAVTDDATCSRCLENNCCDKVGICANTAGCAATVSGVHSCVIREGLLGARKETACAADHMLSAQHEANDAYRCMRDGCGAACGLPVCAVDPAALLIHSANCDGCFASSCCPQLNSCYGSRACKLTVECIVKDCGAELGHDLDEQLAHASPDASGPVPDFCADGGASGDVNVTACVRKCLCEFKDNDQGLPPVDPEKEPLILALRVYQCGANASCGTFCTDPAVDAAAP